MSTLQSKPPVDILDKYTDACSQYLGSRSHPLHRPNGDAWLEELRGWRDDGTIPHSLTCAAATVANLRSSPGVKAYSTIRARGDSTALSNAEYQDLTKYCHATRNLYEHLQSLVFPSVTQAETTEDIVLSRDIQDASKRRRRRLTCLDALCQTILNATTLATAGSERRPGHVNSHEEALRSLSDSNSTAQKKLDSALTLAIQLDAWHRFASTTPSDHFSEDCIQCGSLNDLQEKIGNMQGRLHEPSQMLADIAAGREAKARVLLTHLQQRGIDLRPASQSSIRPV